MPSIEDKIDQYKKTNSIRHEWDLETHKWYFSIVDSVGIAAKSSDPRNYWKVLKNRLKKAHSELVTSCNQLKMRSKDGKLYLTDAADAETTLKIVETVDPKSVPYFRHFFDSFEKELSIAEEKIEDNTAEVSQEKVEEKLSYPQPKNEIEEKEKFAPDFELLLDAYYKNNFIIIRAFTAGVSLDELSIDLTKTSITIAGSRNSPLEGWIGNPRRGGKNTSTSPAVAGTPQEGNFQELYWGNFSRTLEFPEEVLPHQAEKIEDAGMLTIKIPLAHKHAPKKILKMRTI